VDQCHFVGHVSPRPDGSRRRPRHCLLKGCERLFWPEHWRAHYCSAACRQAACRWRRWRASQQYRATEQGKGRRREQSRRYRQRVRERAVASADVVAPREGQRLVTFAKDSAARPCLRPGCYEVFLVQPEHVCKRFCSVACRLALRRVLDRESRYRARRRRRRGERVSQQSPPPDTS
jgi:hypothetical protein